MTTPREHISRSLPPWRTIAETECGQEANQFIRMISHVEAAQKFQQHGARLALKTTCETCWATALRWPGDWETDPYHVLARDFFATLDHWPVTLELHALGWLYAAHQDEFIYTLTQLREIADGSS